MRDRLLVALVSLTLAVVAVLLVERGYATTRLIHAEEQRKVERSADMLAVFLGAPGPKVPPATLVRVLYDGERLVYVDARGHRTEVSNHVEDTAQDGADLRVSRAVPGGGRLTLTRQSEVVDARVQSALLRLVLVALAVAVASGAVAVLLARRLSRPFTELAAVADRIGRGDFDVEVPRYTVPEADAVGRALRASARDLSALVRRERQFAAHASHELRTPITATRLEIEDLALSSQTSPEVTSRLSAALGQLDRLSETVADMLDASRESRVGSSVDIDLAALVRDTVARWRALAPGRSVEVTCDDVVPVRLPAAALMQVMDVLVGNAVTHGEGAVRVSVTQTPAYAEVRVGDEGSRDRAASRIRGPETVGPAARASSAGAPAGGLAAATEIVGSLGGQLRLTEDRNTTFSLVLPPAVRESVVP